MYIGRCASTNGSADGESKGTNLAGESPAERGDDDREQNLHLAALSGPKYVLTDKILL